MHRLMNDYCNYNLWANRRIIDLFQPESKALWERKVISSFPSVQQTMLHIWNAETIWLSRLQGHSPTKFPSKNFQGSKADLTEGWLATSRQFRDFVAQQNVETIRTIISYRTTAGITYQQHIYEIIQHCMNHGSFHRGQLITLARQLGLTDNLPSTDLIYYYRKKQNELQ